MKEKLWLWGQMEGIQNGRWGLPGNSSIRPADACEYMGIENLFMVREFGKPEFPYEPYAESLKPLRKVVWSLVGAGGTFEEGELDRIVRLKKNYGNVTGAVLDDFFIREEGEKGVFSPAGVSDIRETLHSHNMELWVVLYQHQMDWQIAPYLSECDLITFWTWKSEELHSIEENFRRLQNIVPDARKMLGCYMWDYGNSKPMPAGLMEKQSLFGLQLLKEGDIEGMIFLSTCICDLGLETVEWSRGFIKKMCEVS